MEVIVKIGCTGCLQLFTGQRLNGDRRLLNAGIASLRRGDDHLFHPLLRDDARGHHHDRHGPYPTYDAHSPTTAEPHRYSPLDLSTARIAVNSGELSSPTERAVA